MDSIISTSTRHLQLKSYHFPEGWVDACFEWLREEHKDNIHKMSTNEWCYLIEQQWLFTDLKDFDCSSSLNNISNDVMKFNGTACYQVMSLKNVSKSYYSQVREINGTINENTMVSADNNTYINSANSSESKRVLMLSLTDGVNELNAFEYEPWPHIETSKITIGCKCCLIGPFLIRKRIAFLKEINIELRGGEVEGLATITQLSVIKKELELNTDKTRNGPRNSKRNIKTVKSEMKHKKYEPTEMPINVEDSSKSGNENRLNIRNIAIMDNKLGQSIKKEAEIKIKPGGTKNSFNNFDLVISNNSSFENLPNVKLSLKENLKTENVSQKVFENTSRNSNYLTKEAELDNRTYVAMSETMDKKAVEVVANPTNNPSSTMDINSDQFNEDDEILMSLFMDDLIDGESESINVTKLQKNPEIENLKENNSLISIIDIFNELSEPEENNVLVKQFRIKGVILDFTSKLKIVKDDNDIHRWDLEVLIGDNTASVTCLVDDKYISDKIGFSAEEFQQLKKSSVVDNLKNAFKKFQDDIVKCNTGIYTLEVAENCDKLCVVDYTP